MGKGTDKLYITHSEWSSADLFAASGGAATACKRGDGTFKQLPFNFCAASLQPFKNAVCTASGIIFDSEVILSWLETNTTNPIDGEPLKAEDLIKLNFSHNEDGDGDLVDPVTFKVFTDNTHIIAIRHGDYANVFAYDTVERMNLKSKMWQDLLDDQPFSRSDIITLQNPHSIGARDLSKFKHLSSGTGALLTPKQKKEFLEGNINIGALGNMGDKVLRAKIAVEKARRERESKAVAKTTFAKPTSATEKMINEKKTAANTAVYTTGKTAASFTSTGLSISTSGERAILTDEEFMLRPRVVQHKGYARIETNLGNLNIELHTNTAPKAVWNFVRLAQTGYYQGVTFHRNIPGFMLQGGDPTGTGRGGASIWKKNFNDEFDGPHTHNGRGILSMANKGKNTNGSQFFITYATASHLDRRHTIFGRVIEGSGIKSSDPLTRMENVPTDGSDRPLNKIIIKDIVVYIDPFAEFQKEKSDKEKAEAKAEAIARAGGAEDDKVTWTGKRIFNDGRVIEPSAKGSVGKYLKKTREEGLTAAPTGEVAEEVAWEEPVRKKAKKKSGFGNFDGW